MFKSKHRDIVIPQSEHLRLVGSLAMLWGNREFDRPPFERGSFIAGLGLHDRGYGFLDNSAIGDMPELEWNMITRRGFYMPSSDPIADLLTKFHLRRLASHDSSEERRAMTAEFDSVIDGQLETYGFSRDFFDRIDRITQLCDSISFDFCFESPATGNVSVFPRNARSEEIPVEYSVQDGKIRAEPWPFSVRKYEGYIVAYRSDGYPGRLDPVILTFKLSTR